MIVESKVDVAREKGGKEKKRNLHITNIWESTGILNTLRKPSFGALRYIALWPSWSCIFYVCRLLFRVGFAFMHLYR